MRLTFLFTGLLLQGLSYGSSHIDIEKAVKTGMIRVKMHGTGTYSGESLMLILENTSNKSLHIDIPAGRRFDSEDDNDQDLLLCKDTYMKLGSGKTDSMTVYAFCCQASNSGPGQASTFTIGKMADSNLVKLAQHISTSSYSEGIVQDAVWVVSDDKPMYTVHSNDEKELKYMHEFLHQLTGKEIPDYTVEYKRGEEGEPAFNSEPSRFTHKLEHQINMSTTITCVIFDKHDRVFHKVLVNQPVSPGKYVFEIDFETRGIKGEFTIKLFEGDQLKIRKRFEM